jgi:hypothetical protein
MALSEMSRYQLVTSTHACEWVQFGMLHNCCLVKSRLMTFSMTLCNLNGHLAVSGLMWMTKKLKIVKQKMMK